MSEQVTIEVSERVARTAASTAARSGRRMEDVLADFLERAVEVVPIEELSDDEVLRLSTSMMSLEDDEELSDLLADNREDTLDIEGHRRLDELMRVYERGLLRKSEALREAVMRGLRPPLSP